MIDLNASKIYLLRKQDSSCQYLQDISGFCKTSNKQFVLIGIFFAKDSIMRIAMTIYQNRISPVFDVSCLATIIDVENQSVKNEQEISLAEYEFVEKVRYISSFGVKILICGAISCQMQRIADSFGLHVIPFISGEVSEVLSDFLKNPDSLNRNNFMPGCKNRMRRRRMNCKNQSTDMNFCRRINKQINEI